MTRQPNNPDELESFVLGIAKDPNFIEFGSWIKRVDASGKWQTFGRLWRVNLPVSRSTQRIYYFTAKTQNGYKSDRMKVAIGNLLWSGHNTGRYKQITELETLAVLGERMQHSTFDLIPEGCGRSEDGGLHEEAPARRSSTA